MHSFSLTGHKQILKDELKLILQDKFKFKREANHNKDDMLFKTAIKIMVKQNMEWSPIQRDVRVLVHSFLIIQKKRNGC